jgi:hypothetical protein
MAAAVSARAHPDDRSFILSRREVTAYEAFLVDSLETES